MFVYNRADNTRQTLRALLANTLAPQTELYVFSDGGRDEASWALVHEVRSLLREVEAEVTATGGLKAMHIVERPVNYYLERNVVEGIAYVLERHPTIIVLEDDIVTSPYFLEYMNTAFEVYREEPRVMHVAGFTRVVRGVETLCRRAAEAGQQTAADGHTTYFTRFMAGWGWGTWADRWQEHFRHYKSRAEALEGFSPEDIATIEYGGRFHCLQHLDHDPIPWDVCWLIAIYRAGGLCLSPTETLVRNIGLDAGTHFRGLDVSFRLGGRRLCIPFSRLIQHYEFDLPPRRQPLPVAFACPQHDAVTEEIVGQALHDWGIRYTLLGKALRWLKRHWL